mgnify:FL=1
MMPGVPLIAKLVMVGGLAGTELPELQANKPLVIKMLVIKKIHCFCILNVFMLRYSLKVNVVN